MHLQENSTKPKLQLPLQTEQAAAAALRAQLEVELKNKKQCCYESYECTQLTLDGFDYCLKHILQDKNAPFKQCSYVYTSNGKRCHLPAPKGDKKDFGYCSEHALKVTLLKNKQNAKYPPPNTAEVLLQSLSHYIKKPSSTQYSDDVSATMLDDNNELKATKSLDPFTDIDAAGIYNKTCNDVLDLCSESESDVEPSTFSLVWHDSQGDSSDDESDDSEQEDILKHANVYTAEEITLVTRDKLVRLQSLYIEQYRHLQHMLKEKRRRYIHALKREKETCCNIYSQVHDNPKEQRLYKKLKAFNNYHKVHGVDAVLNKRLRDLRAKIVDGVAPKGYGFSKCLFTEGGVKCGERTLPLARHCRKHILEDPSQVLFVPCGKSKGDVQCNTPVEGIFDDSTCWLHMEIPPLQSYSQHRKDSESDMDDSAELSAQLHLPFNENVKTELIDYSLPSEIPKIETLPSLLFEETNDTTTDSAVDSNVFDSALNSHNISPNELNSNNVSPNLSNILPDEPSNENTKMDTSEADHRNFGEIPSLNQNTENTDTTNNISPSNKDEKMDASEPSAEEIPNLNQQPETNVAENEAYADVSNSELSNVKSDLMEVNLASDEGVTQSSEKVSEAPPEIPLSTMEGDKNDTSNLQNVDHVNIVDDANKTEQQ